MGRKGGPSEAEGPNVLRCDKLPNHANRNKDIALRAMLSAWRKAACQMAATQWELFHKTGHFQPLFDPATDYRKSTVAVRSGILLQIADRFGLPDASQASSDEDKKKILPRMAPGLADPLAPLKESLGAAQVQMVRAQVMGTLESFIANRQNDFVATVFGSSLGDCNPRESDDEAMRLERARRALLQHQLFAVNRARAWFDLARLVRIVDAATGRRDVVVPEKVRLLARKIMAHILARHRRPRMQRIGMVVDQRIATLARSETAATFDWWLRLTVARGRKIAIPLKGYAHFDAREGTKKLSFQINEERRTGKITVGVVTDVSAAMAKSRADYARSSSGEVALDFGLSTLFATDKGDLLGRGFMAKLTALDRLITGIARHVQRSGKKPRSSARYNKHVARFRGFIRTEINRVLNRLLAMHRPSRLCLERLDFRAPGLSARMNRILQNCGRSAIKAKLQDLEEKFGVEATEVVSAYTSQTCSCCRYVDKRNRRTRDRFACLWCGTEMHADVNGARNVGSERFRSFGSLRSGLRSIVLDALVKQHAERWPDPESGGLQRKSGVTSDPRLSNPYFKDWAAAAR